MPATIKHYLTTLQDQITQAVADIDRGHAFTKDAWERPSGGSGRTCVLQGGGVFEQAGVNFSHVFGPSLPKAATDGRPELAGQPFEAMGISLVFHPRNPYVPTVHMNLRFFTATPLGGQPIWWFGGGYDLTPYYGFVEDAEHWHRSAKEACDPFGADVYPRFKKACDEYFFLKHRNEARGIGGLFFDDLNEWKFEQCFAFIRSVGDSFLKAYIPIVERRKNISYGDRERNFQCYRRGRYVEFNLVYDRGTLFGLQFGGRIESILVSLPPQVNWRYNWQPESGSAEEKLYTEFLPAKEWV